MSVPTHQSRRARHAVPFEGRQPADVRILDVLGRATRGDFPPFDEMVEVLTRPTGALGAVLAFSGHHIVAADVPAAWVAGYCPPGELTAPLGPRFLEALATRLDARPGAHDLVLWGPARPGRPDLNLSLMTDQTHPRVRRSLRYRHDVRVYAADGGLLTVGRGLAGRWEAGFEVTPDARGKGLGRALAAAAAHLIPAGETLFLQVALGNVASLRAVLAAGYRPIGAELLLT